MGLGIDFAERLAALHRRPHNQLEHAGGLLIKFFSAHLALAYEFEIRRCHIIAVVGICPAHSQAVRPGAEFEVQTIVDGLPGVVAAAPVGNDGPVEAPLPFQYAVQQALIVADVLTAVEIVARHYRPAAAFLHRLFEGREIYFVEGAVVQIDVYGMAIRLFVVETVMLDAAGDSVLLHFAYIRHHHFAGQVRVFAHIFEVAAVQRRTGYVDTRAEQHVFLAVAGLLAYGLAVEGSHFRVPGGCKAGQGREGDYGVIGPAGLVPLVPKHLRAYSVGAVSGPEFGYAEAGHTGARKLALGVDDCDFFFCGHTGERISDSLVEIPAFVLIDRKILFRGAGDKGH